MSRYFSEEGVRESVEKVNSSAEHMKLAQNLTGKILLLALNDPDGNDVMVSYTFAKGRIEDWIYEVEKAPSSMRERPFKPLVDGLSKVTAEYGTFVRLDKGELDPADAVDSPDYKIEANMLMVLPLMQAIDSWNRQVRAIPKEY